MDDLQGKQGGEDKQNLITPTLNKSGYTLNDPDELMKEFAAFGAQHASNYVVDVGACFGVATLLALRKGAKVIANDIDAEHLKQLAEKAKEQKLSAYLTTEAGNFLELSFDESTVAAFLVSRVFHFFTPEQLEESLEKMFQALTPGGKVYISTLTPYLKIFENFLPIYKGKVKRKEDYPGYIENLHQYMKTSDMKEHKQYNPKKFLGLTPSELSEIFTKKGYIVERAEFGTRSWYKEQGIALDGKEDAILVAKKPGLK